VIQLVHKGSVRMYIKEKGKNHTLALFFVKRKLLVLEEDQSTAGGSVHAFVIAYIIPEHKYHMKIFLYHTYIFGNVRYSLKQQI
jgi:hypothetical protein